MPHRSRTSSPRQQVSLQAQQAARWMLDSGSHDFNAARRHCLGHSAAQRRDQPSNSAIDQALIDYQRLFQQQRYREQLRNLHIAAIGAMQLLERFRPRLVGELISGSLVPRSPVRLHLWADTPEQVAIFLLDQHIPHQLDQCSLSFGPKQRRELPLYRFEADEQIIELTVFPFEGQHQAPLSPVDGHPMQRLNPAEVKQRLAKIENGEEAV